MRRLAAARQARRTKTCWTKVWKSCPWYASGLDILTHLGVDFVQEKFLGQGPQDNEVCVPEAGQLRFFDINQSALEQAKDEQISDFIRGQYKNATGSDMPIKDKPTTFE